MKKLFLFKIFFILFIISATSFSIEDRKRIFWNSWENADTAQQ